VEAHRSKLKAEVWTAAVGAVVTTLTVAVIGWGGQAWNAATAWIGEDQQEGSAPRNLDPPFEWTIAPNERYCLNFVIDRPPQDVPPPPRGGGDEWSWAAGQGGTPAGRRDVRVTLQGKSKAAVVLQELVVEVRKRPLAPGVAVYKPHGACGGAIAVRWFSTELDRGTAVPHSNSLYGRPIEFPYRISRGEPEVLVIAAAARRCDCEWTLRLKWSSGARTGTTVIDNNGEPFVTAGLRGRSEYFYDGVAWIKE